jgi:hypothetical protein
MTRAVHKVERVAHGAKVAAVIVFRIVVVCIFAPIAIAAFAKDDTAGGWIAVACAFILAGLLGPMPEE